MMIASRIVWLVTGGLWATSSVVDFTDADYLDPATTLDWIALWSWSAASVFLSASVLLLARLASSRPAMIAAIVVASGGFVAGVANALEDGFGMKEMGLFYVVGFATLWLGLLGLAMTFLQGGYSQLAALLVALLVGVTTFPVGGAFVILFAFGAVSVAPSWFSAPSPRPTRAGPDPAGL